MGKVGSTPNEPEGESAARQIIELRQAIERHNRLYFQQAAPEISDLEFDRLVQQLAKLESRFPDLIAPESPTQRVGETPVSQLAQVEHRQPMLSIDNTYSENELRAYFRRTLELLDDEPVEWVVELKIDGVAASLIYEDGLLRRAVTRGNGFVGDDITHNIRTIPECPHTLSGEHIPKVLEVRGEVYMDNEDLVALNERRARNGEPPFKNTRNVTAGTIRLLDPSICAERRLKFFAHSVGYCEGLSKPTHQDFLQLVASYGIPMTPKIAVLSDVDEVIRYCNRLVQEIAELEFEVDGIVIKVNSLAQRERLGSTSKSPRWIIAYKIEKYEAETRVMAITTQVGKTGAITPVGELEPVELAGTTVSRCSLHNADEIARKDIRIGDWVVVEKAGKIIPHIVRVEKHKRPDNAVAFEFPTKCPACDTSLVRDEGGVYIRCPSMQCIAQWKQRLRYFATRDCMDIEGLGDKVIEQLVDAGMVASFRDLYRLTSAELVKLERMGKKSAEKLVANIHSSKQRGLARVLNAISIRHVGKSVAKLLSKKFGSMEALMSATEQEIAAIDEVGEVIASSVHQFLASENGKELIEQLRQAGVRLADAIEPSGLGGQKFSGMTFVVTGKLEKYTRDEIHRMIESQAGKPSSSISSKTTYLVAGGKTGSKLEKAKSLGVRVLSEADFERLLHAD